MRILIKIGPSTIKLLQKNDKHRNRAIYRFVFIQPTRFSK